MCIRFSGPPSPQGLYCYTGRENQVLHIRFSGPSGVRQRHAECGVTCSPPVVYLWATLQIAFGAPSRRQIIAGHRAPTSPTTQGLYHLTASANQVLQIRFLDALWRTRRGRPRHQLRAAGLYHLSASTNQVLQIRFLDALWRTRRGRPRHQLRAAGL